MKNQNEKFLYFTDEEIMSFFTKQDFCYLDIGEGEEKYYCLYEDIPEIVEYITRFNQEDKFVTFFRPIVGEDGYLPIICAFYGNTLLNPYDKTIIPTLGEQLLELMEKDMTIPVDGPPSFKIMDYDRVAELAEEYLAQCEAEEKSSTDEER